jgi:hypothetical protein
MALENENDLPNLKRRHLKIKMTIQTCIWPKTRFFLTPWTRKGRFSLPGCPERWGEATDEPGLAHQSVAMSARGDARPAKHAARRKKLAGDDVRSLILMAKEITSLITSTPSFGKWRAGDGDEGTARARYFPPPRPAIRRAGSGGMENYCRRTSMGSDLGSAP